MKYKGFTIKKSKIDNKYFAFNEKTGDLKGGSSRTFLENNLKKLKEKIDYAKNTDEVKK